MRKMKKNDQIENEFFLLYVFRRRALRLPPHTHSARALSVFFEVFFSWSCGGGGLVRAWETGTRTAKGFERGEGGACALVKRKRLPSPLVR